MFEPYAAAVKAAALSRTAAQIQVHTLRRDVGEPRTEARRAAQRRPTADALTACRDNQLHYAALHTPHLGSRRDHLDVSDRYKIRH
jgi:hypothetical protein